MTQALVRPVREGDLDGLAALAEQTSFGLTNLPRNRELLAKRIAASLEAFAKIEDKPRGESYLFVLEQADGGEITGTSAIVSKVGGFEPFYSYAIEARVHASETLGVRKEISALHLERDHDGPCEIGGLFVAPDWRTGGSGRLVSIARFLFMADHPGLFDPVVIAEMRGVNDEHGRSPFWEAVGRHFFDVDFPTADYLSAVDKRFIAELMPEHPIYIPLLSPEARSVIGRVHEKTEPALKMLEAEGFEKGTRVDIFDAGPIVSCRLDRIRAIRESIVCPIAKLTDERPSGEVYIVSNTELEFRACLAAVDRSSADGVRLGREEARILRVGVGDHVRIVAPRPAGAAGPSDRRSGAYR